LRTLSSELGPVAERLGSRPRVYVDANVPSGLVAFMRERLSWDVLFVMEHEELRRARDDEHYRLARRMRRTLVTLDRDYRDDRRFPPEESGGVIIASGADERVLARVLTRVDREIFRRTPDGDVDPSPLAGRKLDVHPGWPDEP
jgi:hypothetical protein